MATYGKIGFLVGAGGDVALQLINYYVPWLRNRGLVNYFRKHTKISSVLQAAGLTSLWSALYASQAGRNAGYRGFIVFSIFVDILYRLGHPYLYPTLDSYYEKNKWYSTVAYNAITAMMVQFGVDFYRLTQAQKLKTQYVY
jgi:hypothetical protein